MDTREPRSHLEDRDGTNRARAGADVCVGDTSECSLKEQTFGWRFVIENLIVSHAMRKISGTGDSPQGSRTGMLSRSQGEMIQIDVRNHRFNEVSKHGMDSPER